MEWPPIAAGAQIEGAAPCVRTLDDMLEAMRKTPPLDPQRPPLVIPVRPTLPPFSGADPSGTPDDLGAGNG